MFHDIVMKDTMVSYKKQKRFILREHLGVLSLFSWVCVAHSFSFLCSRFLLCLSSFCFFVPAVVSVSELSFLITLRFSLTFV